MTIQSSTGTQIPQPLVASVGGKAVLYPKGCLFVKLEGKDALVRGFKRVMSWRSGYKQCICDICHMKNCSFHGKDHFPREIDGSEQVYTIFQPPGESCLISRRNGKSWSIFSMSCALEKKKPFQDCGLKRQCNDAKICEAYDPYK